jgi:serine/threonine protein kinase
MGEVWEARHLELAAPVAIKFAVERRIGDKSFLARFQREACALARLRYPNIVQVFDIGTYAGFPFLVMELLVGETLKSKLERESRLTISDSAQIVTQVARALTIIHSSGMVHRDVTPANLFLTEQSPELPEIHIKLLDFGIVKDVTTDARVTVSGVAVGSPAYMSPEQARAERVDKRSDLWSLGALAFRAITGGDPFTGSCVTDVLFAICTGEIPSVGPRFAPHTAKLDAFFARAMARNPDHRFGNAADLAASFRKIAVAVDQSLADDVSVSSSRPAFAGLERVGVTIDTDPNSSRPAMGVRRVSGIRRIQLLLWVLSLLGVGVAAGYSLAINRQDKSITNVRAEPDPPQIVEAPTMPTPMPNPKVSAELVAGNPTPSSQMTQDQRGTAVLPTNKRGTTNTLPSPRPSNDAVDPVFGLPIQK